MGVVRPKGTRRRRTAPSSRSRRCIWAVERRARSATPRTTSSSSPSPVAASSTATGSPTAARRCCSRERQPSSGGRRRDLAACASRSEATPTCTRRWAHVSASSRSNAVEPGKATGSRSFQILYGPHNGSRARDDVRRLRAAGPRAVALPPLRRDLLDLARSRPLPPRRRGGAARGRLLLPDHAA